MDFSKVCHSLDGAIKCRSLKQPMEWNENIVSTHRDHPKATENPATSWFSVTLEVESVALHWGDSEWYISKMNCPSETYKVLWIWTPWSCKVFNLKLNIWKYSTQWSFCNFYNSGMYWSLCTFFTMNKSWNEEAIVPSAQMDCSARHFKDCRNRSV